MDIFRAIVLGVVQGLTEFLPVSSSAHLIIIPWLADWETFGLAFDVSLHLGTLVAVLIYFRTDLIGIVSRTLAELPVILRGQVPVDPLARQGLFIGLGTIPAAVVGFLLEDTIDSYFHGDPISDSAIIIIALVLIVVGLVLGWADRRLARSGYGVSIERISLKQALLIGVAQTLALVPGASRSGSTITAGLFVGLSRPAAARFSFLLGVPVILGAGVKQIWDLIQDPADIEVSIFAAGMLSAGIVGYLAIAGLLRFLTRHTVDVFVVYRIIVGIGVLLVLALGVR